MPGRIRLGCGRPLVPSSRPPFAQSAAEGIRGRTCVIDHPAALAYHPRKFAVVSEIPLTLPATPHCAFSLLVAFEINYIT